MLGQKLTTMEGGKNKKHFNNQIQQRYSAIERNIQFCPKVFHEETSPARCSHHKSPLRWGWVVAN